MSLSRGRRTAIVLIALVVIPLLVLASGGVWFWWQLDPPGHAGKSVEVQIAKGWGVPKIGDELSHDGVIDSPLVFNVYARLNGDTKLSGYIRAAQALACGPQ